MIDEAAVNEPEATPPDATAPGSTPPDATPPGSTAPGSQQPESPQPEPLTSWVVLGWVSVLSGPLAYAVSRLVAETFYGRFHVLPSEVGLSYGTMVAPALIVMVATAVLGGLVILVGRAVVGFGALALAGMFVKFYDLDRRGILLLVASLVLLGLLWGIGSLTAKLGRPFWISALCLTVVVVGALALRTARREADGVARGEPVTPSVFGLPLTTIRAARVKLTGVDTPAALPRDRCVMLLGSSGGVAVVVDGASVWRVPADYAMTASGC